MKKRKSYYIASNPIKLARSQKIVKAVQLELQSLWLHQAITPKEMALMSGVSISTARSHRQHKTQNPRFNTVMALARCSGKTLGQILRGYETVAALTSISSPSTKPFKNVKIPRLTKSSVRVDVH